MRNSRYHVVPYYNLSHQELEKELNKHDDRYVVSVTAIRYENAASTNVGHLDWVVVYKL